MKKLSLLLACLTILATLFVGCNKTHDAIQNNVGVDPDCPISTKRTGMFRNFSGFGFECTDQGAYFMCFAGKYSWLYYVDHGSDNIIKLCGRPECEHKDEDCNACFPSGYGIRYYDGYLYTCQVMGESKDDCIIRMNPDGTEQEAIFNMKKFRTKYKYRGWNGGLVSPYFYKGLVYFPASKLDDDGNIVVNRYCYRLDGSLQEPEQVTSVPFFSDGDVIIGHDYDYSAKEHVYGIWELGKGITKELFKDNAIPSGVYIGENAEYYINDGVVYERTYPDDIKVLFDTGLRDNKQSLFCFPDCITVFETVYDSSDNTKTEYLLHFYDWKYNHLGSVKLDYETFGSYTYKLRGETPDKIILTDDDFPKYYIDKSDFGTGNIEIHEFNLLDGDWDK